jgi:hypothetical protein
VPGAGPSAGALRSVWIGECVPGAVHAALVSLSGLETLYYCLPPPTSALDTITRRAETPFPFLTRLCICAHAHSELALLPMLLLLRRLHLDLKDADSAVLCAVAGLHSVHYVHVRFLRSSSIRARNVLELCRLLRLQALTLVHCDMNYLWLPIDITDGDVATLAASLPCLRRLELLLAAPQLTVRLLRSIGTHCHRLEHLFIGVTAAVLHLLDKSGKVSGGAANSSNGHGDDGHSIDGCGSVRPSSFSTCATFFLPTARRPRVRAFQANTFWPLQPPTCYCALRRSCACIMQRGRNSMTWATSYMTFYKCTVIVAVTACRLWFSCVYCWLRSMATLISGPMPCGVDIHSVRGSIERRTIRKGNKIVNKTFALSESLARDGRCLKIVKCLVHKYFVPFLSMSNINHDGTDSVELLVTLSSHRAVLLLCCLLGIPRACHEHSAFLSLHCILCLVEHSLPID